MALKDVLTLSIVSHGHGLLLHSLLVELDSEPSLAGVKVVVTLNLTGEAFDTSGFDSLDLHLITNPAPRGFGANHNAAFGHCTTAWFGVLNPDLALSGGEPFSALLGLAGAVSAIGALAPAVVGPSGAAEDSVRPNLTPWSLVARHLFGRKTRLEVKGPTRTGTPFYWLAGMCMLLRADAYRHVGGFDERFFLYCEDYDLCARLYVAGYAIWFEPIARIVHSAQRDSHRSLDHLGWHVSSLLKAWSSRAYWTISWPWTRRRQSRPA